MPFGEPTPHRTGSQRQHNWTFPSLFCNFSHSFTTDHSIRLSEARDEPNLRFTPLHFPQFVPGEDAVPSHPQRSEHGGGTGEWRRSRGGEIDQRERRIWWFVQLVQRDSSNGAVAGSYSFQHRPDPPRRVLPSSLQIALVRYPPLSCSSFLGSI